MTRFLEPFAADRQALLSFVGTTERTWKAFQAEARLGTEPSADADGLIAQELDTIRQRLAAHRFDIGLFGLIKRGKSTLLNALLGTQVSATSITPETPSLSASSTATRPERVSTSWMVESRTCRSTKHATTHLRRPTAPTS